MAKKVSNMKQLQKAIMPVMEGMADALAERVYETLNYFILDYYKGYEPSSYQRTQDYLQSAIKVDAHPYKSGVRATVYIDYDSLNSYGVSGHQVAKWSNEGTHGGMEVDHKPHVCRILWI